MQVRCSGSGGALKAVEVPCAGQGAAFTADTGCAKSNVGRRPAQALCILEKVYFGEGESGHKHPPKSLTGLCVAGCSDALV